MKPLPLIPKQKFIFKSKYLPKGRLEFYPFTAGQESIPLAVKNDSTDKDKMNAVKQVIQECVVDNIDITTLPLFVLEELFIRISEKSSGEMIDTAFICKNVITTENESAECNAPVYLNFNLNDVKLNVPEGFTDKIALTEDIGIKMKFLTLEMLDSIEDDEKNIDNILYMIEYIYDKDEIYQCSDYTLEELTNFYNTLTLKQTKMIYDGFFKKIPHLNYQQTVQCKKCGYEHSLQFTSLTDFFL